MSNPDHAWFRDARFGMFLHFGLYSVLGRNEWALYVDRIPFPEYARLADRFAPKHFDADAWAGTAAEAGMRYMVLTTRHHDGFCLYDSAVSDFTSTKTAAKRDFVAAYVEACRRAGLKVGLYYSLGDWRYRGCWDHKQYPESAEAMVQQAHAQVRELLTNYGHIDILWFDGERHSDDQWDAGEPTVAEFWRSEDMNAMARGLQPHLLINNRNGLPGDYDTPECQIKASEEGRAWESCLQMDSLSWGNIPHSPCLRTTPQIVRDLVEVAAGGGNLLLNTGPTPDGTLRKKEAKRILRAGAWLRRNAAAIYGSRRSALNVWGPFGPAGVLARWIGTDDPTVQHLVALCWTGREFITNLLDGEVTRVTLLATGEPVEFRRGPYGRFTLVNLPQRPPDPLATVFRVEFAAPPTAHPLPKGPSWVDSEL